MKSCIRDRRSWRSDACFFIMCTLICSDGSSATKLSQRSFPTLSDTSMVLISDDDQGQDDEEVYAYSNLLADGENISKLKHDAHEAKTLAKNKKIAEKKKPVKMTEKDEDDEIAGYSDSLIDENDSDDDSG